MLIQRVSMRNSTVPLTPCYGAGLAKVTLLLLVFPGEEVLLPAFAEQPSLASLIGGARRRT